MKEQFLDIEKLKINNNERKKINKINYDQYDSYTNFKNSIIHKKNFLFPFEKPEQSEIIKNNK